MNGVKFKLTVFDEKGKKVNLKDAETLENLVNDTIETKKVNFNKIAYTFKLLYKITAQKRYMMLFIELIIAIITWNYSRSLQLLRDKWEPSFPVQVS